MSASTHAAFNIRPSDLKGDIPTAFGNATAPFRSFDGPFSSRATGVGLGPPFSPSVLRGVLTAASVSVTPACRFVVGYPAAPLALASLAVGVGHKEDTFSPMGGANVGSTDETTFDPITEPSEVADNTVQPSRKKGRNVFDDDEARPDFLDDARVFAPETGTLAVDAGSFTGVGNVLAGESTTEHVNRRKTSRIADVTEPFGLGPMSLKNAPAKRVDFDLPDYGADPGMLQTQLKTADAGE